MITAEELRLGNLLMTIKNDHIVTVGIDEIIYIYEDKRTHKLMGIPLTQEWLEKLGFKQAPRMDEGFFRHKRFLHYCRLGKGDSKENTFVRVGDFCGESFSQLCAIHYVHQLQNLYFAITGDELTEQEKFIEI